MRDAAMPLSHRAGESDSLSTARKIGWIGRAESSDQNQVLGIGSGRITANSQFSTREGTLVIKRACAATHWPLGCRTVVDPLEPRRLLSAAPFTSQTIEWQGAPVEVAAGRWIVQVDASSSQSVSKQSADLRASLSKLAPGFSLDRQLGSDGLYRLTGPVDLAADAVARELTALPGFRFFEPDFLVHADATPSDPSFGQLWGMNNVGQFGGLSGTDIRATQAWNITTGSSSNVVGVIDTGVDYNHPDLAANIWTNPGEIAGNGVDDDGNGYVDDIHGWDFVNGDNDPMDDNNHGTHVSGTIGAVANNGTGVAGVNWSVKIMALKFLAANGQGATSDAVSCVNYATMMHNRGVNIGVTNNSWGGGGSDAALYNAIQAAGDSGMLFVAAAGNDGQNLDTGFTSYPASYDLPNIISVANITSSDQLNGGSNYGVNSVDLGAPGTSILSTIRNNNYAFFSGTSMASPHVAGVAGLLFGMAPTAGWQAVRTAILSGVDADAALAGKTVTGGRLNAFKAVQAFTQHPDLLAASDSGASSTDNITKDDTPTFTGTAVADATVTLFANGLEVASGAADSAGVYSLTSTSLSDGTYNITATWPGQTGPVVPLSIRVDTVSAVPAAPELAAADDSGSSNSDGITKLTTLHVSGTSEPGTASIYVDGNLIGSSSVPAGGRYNATASGLAPGAHSFTAVVSDIAGNVASAASVPLQVTVKTSVGVPSAPDLDPSRDSGNNTDNITRFLVLKFVGNSDDGAVTLLVDGNPFSSGVAIGGVYTINPPTIQQGTHTFATYVTDLAGNVSATSAPLTVTVDLTRPTVTLSDFAFDASVQQLNLTFSENVQASIQRQDLLLVDADAQTTISFANTAVSYAAGSNIATFTFPGLPGAVLPDGNYQAVVASNGVSDVAGNTLVDSITEFFVLSGDTNRDRVVDTVDFNTLAANFGAGGSFSAGDFNYDSVVDTTDFNLLAANFNKSLPAPQTPPGAAAAAVTASTFSNQMLGGAQRAATELLDLETAALV
jgi:subtilisin family serine protease